MPNPKFSFNLKPKEAIEYLQDKGFKQSFNYDEIMHESHHRSFTVAKMMNDDLLKNVHGSLVKAQKDGMGFKEWKENIKPTLKSAGWYGETDVVNPETGEVKTIFVGSRRLRTIYETNMRVSHAVGRYKKLAALPLSKYWMYVSMLLPTTRTSHADKHGTVLPRGHTWWDTNYPPNAWNCKCKVRAYSKRDLDKRGIEVAATSPESIATKDWAYHVGKSDASNLKSLRKKKILEMPEELKKKATESMKLDDIYTKMLNSMPLGLGTYLLKNRPKMSFRKPVKGKIVADAQYDPNTKEIIFWTKSPEVWQTRHELAHHVDKLNNWISLKKIKSSLLLERKQLLKVEEQELIDFLKTHHDPAIHDLIRINFPKIVGVDTRPDRAIDLPTGLKETFANILEIIMSGDDRGAIIQKYFPLTYKRIETIIKDL